MSAYAENPKENRTQTLVASVAPHGANAALAIVDNRPKIHQLKPVIQRKILINGEFKKPYDDDLITEQAEAAKPYIKQWGQMSTLFNSGGSAATKRAITAYLDLEDTDDDHNTLRNDIRVALRKNDNKTYGTSEELTRQLIQDVKLKLLGVDSLMGIDQQDGQFSEKADDVGVGRTGKTKTLRIYRTMKAEDWNAYKESNNPRDILFGHGGSLGQAMHYFLKSKKDDLDDVLVEFEFSNTAQNLVDYTRISRGGEGDGPHAGKLTGKKEANDTFALDEDIFSINLSKSKDLITLLNPKITLKDKVR